MSDPCCVFLPPKSSIVVSCSGAQVLHGVQALDLGLQLCKLFDTGALELCLQRELSPQSEEDLFGALLAGDS